MRGEDEKGKQFDDFGWSNMRVKEFKTEKINFSTANGLKPTLLS
jgi:hypothetical protein